MKLVKLLNDDDCEREKTLASLPTDGLFVGALKWIFRWNIWHWANRRFVWSVLKRKKRLDYDFTEEAMARYEIQYVLDLYTLLVTALLIIAYVTWYFLYNTGWLVVAIPFLIVAPYRVIEVLQLDLWLHLREPRKRPATLRQLVLALVGYGHMILAFAVGHLVISDLSCDKYGTSTDLRASFINALYFSAVTGATLGYGDFSPQRSPGKCLVMLEIAVSFVFIVVILQRAVSAAPKDTV